MSVAIVFGVLAGSTAKLQTLWSCRLSGGLWSFVAILAGFIFSMGGCAGSQWGKSDVSHNGVSVR